MSGINLPFPGASTTSTTVSTSSSSWPVCPFPNPGLRPGLEVSKLNEYTGYFSNQSTGDWPVVVVANTIEEAARILRLPGAYTPEPMDPTMVKITRTDVGVARPVNRIGFTTSIMPEGAVISGADATPHQYTVTNGDNVIFTASKPFGWKFKGWYKGFSSQPEATWTKISDNQVCEVQVYDPYNTLLEYIALYEFDPQLQNGRYIDINSGTIFDMKFDGYSNYAGRIIYSPDTANVYNWVVAVLDQATKTINCIPEPMIIQPEVIPVTFTYQETPIGINLIVQAISVTNPMAWSTGSVISLKWIQSQGPGSI